MRYTNKNNLPAPIFGAIANRQKPQIPKADMYATSLIDSPQIKRLKIKHEDEIEEDVSNMIWALIGQCTHEILEKSAIFDAAWEQGLIMVEKPFVADYGEHKVGAIIDHYYKGIHSDYKTTSVWSVIHDKGDYVKQLNVGSDILIRNGFEVKKHQNVLILRDWNKNEASRNEDYPQSQIFVKEQPLWDKVTRERYIIDRLEKHFGSNKQMDCTETERWYTGDKWAVMHNDQKKAKRVLDTKEDAEAWVDNFLGDKDKLKIIKRVCENRRCENYCSVKDFCPQYRSMK